jgi:hypothetical protein
LVSHPEEGNSSDGSEDRVLRRVFLIKKNAKEMGECCIFRNFKFVTFNKY